MKKLLYVLLTVALFLPISCDDSSNSTPNFEGVVWEMDYYVMKITTEINGEIGEPSEIKYSPIDDKMRPYLYLEDKTAWSATEFLEGYDGPLGLYGGRVIEYKSPADIYIRVQEEGFLSGYGEDYGILDYEITGSYSCDDDKFIIGGKLVYTSVNESGDTIWLENIHTDIYIKSNRKTPEEIKNAPPMPDPVP